MYPFVFSSIMTAFILLLDLRSKAIQPLYRYLAIFFLFAGILFLFPSKANADIFERTYLCRDYKNQVIINLKDDTQETKETKKTPHDKRKELMDDCKERMCYHYEEGVKCLNQAEEACLWFPESSDIEKARFCFTTFFATLAPSTPKDKALAALLAMCMQYGDFVSREWQFIDTKLHQAKYHFEMEEHYRITGKFIATQLNTDKKIERLEKK